MQRITELEGEPVVGRFYLVPCVFRPLCGWFPIIGPQHDDSEVIGIPGAHYHYDSRFLSDDQIADLTWGSGLASDPKYVLGTVCWVGGDEYQPTFKRLKCRREVLEFPLHDPKGRALRWMPKLERAYKDAKLSCMRCPHRGIPLNGLPVKDGMVTCPGHGLRWNVETGEMVSRLST